MQIDPEIAGRSIAYPELVRLIKSSHHSDTRKRDMVSAVNRVLKMGGVWGSTFVFTVDSAAPAACLDQAGSAWRVAKILCQHPI